MPSALSKAAGADFYERHRHRGKSSSNVSLGCVFPKMPLEAGGVFW